MGAFDHIPWPGPVNIKGQKYLTPEGDFVRVTTALKAFGGSTEGLIKWSATEERKAVLEAAREVYAGDTVTNGPDEFAAAVEANLGQARSHQKQLAKAAEIGTSIHNAIEYRLKADIGQTVGQKPALSDQALWAFMAWEDWWNGAGLTPVRIEQPIWDPHVGFAGTIDLLAEGPDGLELLDWKSSKGIYESHHMQVAAYGHAARRWAPIVRSRIVRVPKNVEDPLFEVRELGEMYGGRKMTEEQLFRAFCSALDLYNLLMAPTK